MSKGIELNDDVLDKSVYGGKYLTVTNGVGFIKLKYGMTTKVAFTTPHGRKCTKMGKRTRCCRGFHCVLQ